MKLNHLQKAIEGLQEEALLNPSDEVKSALALVVTARQKLVIKTPRKTDRSKKVRADFMAQIIVGIGELPEEELAVIWLEVYKALDRIEQQQQEEEAAA